MKDFLEEVISKLRPKEGGSEGQQSVCSVGEMACVKQIERKHGGKLARGRD